MSSTYNRKESSNGSLLMLSFICGPYFTEGVVLYLEKLLRCRGDKNHLYTRLAKQETNSIKTTENGLKRENYNAVKLVKTK